MLRLASLALTGLLTASLLLSAPSAIPARAQSNEMVHGVIVDTTNPQSMKMAREAGFTHAKMVLYWPRLEPGPGQFRWNDSDQNDLDNVIRAADAEDMKLVGHAAFR